MGSHILRTALSGKACFLVPVKMNKLLQALLVTTLASMVLSSPLVSNTKVDIKDNLFPKNDITCAICEAFVITVSNAIQNGVTDIAHLLIELVCKPLPGSLETNCIEFVEAQVDNIVEAIVDANFDSTVICELPCSTS